MDAAESNIDAVESDMDAVEDRLDTAESEMDTAQSDIDAVESAINVVESDMDAVEDRLEAVEDGVDFDEVFSVSDGFKPTKGNVLTYIDIVDEMHFEMDITIHSFPSSWASILHCSDANYPRLPGIWIHPDSDTNVGFHVKWSNADNINYGPNTGEALVAGQTYHLEMDIAQGYLKVTVDGVIRHEASGLASHSTYEDLVCYASDPWYNAADVTISNLLIGIPGGSDMDAVEGRLDTVESEMDVVQSGVGTLETEMDAAESNIDAVESDVSTLQGSMSSVESDMSTAQSDIDAVESNVGTIQSDVDAVEDRLDTAESEMDTVQSDVDAVESEVDSIQSDMNAVEVRLEVVEDGVHFDEVFSTSDGFKPTKGNVLTYIDIVDEMHFEMDITIHSFPSSWASILHCSDANYPRLPGIWIHPDSDTNVGFHVKWSNADNINYGPNTGEALVAGQTYHLEMDIAQGYLKVTVDGVIRHEASGLASHSTYEDLVCYASDPWYDAADVTISNLLIGIPGGSDVEAVA